jgi:hypothetical protein
MTITMYRDEHLVELFMHVADRRRDHSEPSIYYVIVVYKALVPIIFLT